MLMPLAKSWMPLPYGLVGVERGRVGAVADDEELVAAHEHAADWSVCSALNKNTLFAPLVSTS